MVLRLTVNTPSDSVAQFEFALDTPRVTLGRSASCDVQLPYPTISAHHLTIVREGEAWLVADAGSTNGTELNQLPLERDHFTPLQEGDVLAINAITLTVRFPLYIPGGVTTAEESGELVRRMAASYLKHQGPLHEQQAWFEILHGPDYGERWLIPDGAWRMTLGHGASSGAWRLRDEHLPAGALLLASDGEVTSLQVAPSATLSAIVDGHQVAPGITVRVRAGSRIQAGRTVLLLVEPLEAYLRQLEAVPHKIRHTTSPFHRIDTPDDDEPPPDAGFEPSPTRRVDRATPLKSPAPRTAQGLPLRDAHASGLASAARAQALAPPEPQRGRWSLLDVTLFSAALLLGVTALVVLLMIFGVL